MKKVIQILPILFIMLVISNVNLYSQKPRLHYDDTIYFGSPKNPILSTDPEIRRKVAFTDTSYSGIYILKSYIENDYYKFLFTSPHFNPNELLDSNHTFTFYVGFRPYYLTMGPKNPPPAVLKIIYKTQTSETIFDTLSILIAYYFLNSPIQSPPFPNRVTLEVPNLKVNLNENFLLPILIAKDTTIINNQIDSISFHLLVNSTVLTPTSPYKRGVIENGIQRIPISFNLSPNTDLTKVDTLTSIDLFTMLGNSVSSSIRIENAQYFYKGGLISTNSYYNNGNLIIKDIFYEDSIPRLINIGRTSDSLRISFTQSIQNGTYKLDFHYIGKANFEVYDMNGIEITLPRISNFLELHTGPYYSNLTNPIILTKSDFPINGVYIIRLNTLSSSSSKIIFVE